MILDNVKPGDEFYCLVGDKVYFGVITKIQFCRIIVTYDDKIVCEYKNDYNYPNLFLLKNQDEKVMFLLGTL